MIKQKRMVRIKSEGETIKLISRQKNGNLRESELADNLLSATPLCAADDAILLYDGKTLIVTGGNMTIID